jgi:ribosomal-protein-alanine N-acetyltransferase
MLIGPHIRLQPPAPDDAARLAAWFSDPEYMGAYNTVWPTTRQEWERTLANPSGGHDTGLFLIVRRAPEEPLGMCGYFNPFTLTDFFLGREIWYQVAPPFRGQGVATQAACLLINHLFAALPLPRVQATVNVANTASCRVLERAGMQRDGLYRQVTFLAGHYADMYLYAITRADWSDEATYRAARPPF